MGRVYSWDEQHGWHAFTDAENRLHNWNVGYCDLCDCLQSDHIPREQYVPTYERSQRLAGTPLPDRFL
jgi:hypothetical protein